MKPKRKFSSFFKNLIIELEKDMYGPENHLVEVFIEFNCIKDFLIISGGIEVVSEVV